MSFQRTPATIANPTPLPTLCRLATSGSLRSMRSPGCDQQVRDSRNNVGNGFPHHSPDRYRRSPSWSGVDAHVGHIKTSQPREWYVQGDTHIACQSQRQPSAQREVAWLEKLREPTCRCGTGFGCVGRQSSARLRSAGTQTRWRNVSRDTMSLGRARSTVRDVATDAWYANCLAVIAEGLSP
jgi:hypothetical protein